MSAAHVRRGGARAKPRRAPRLGAKKIAKRLPVDQRRANKLAGLVFAAFLLAIGVVVIIALDIPAKAERAAGSVIGRAGFTVNGYQIVGLRHMNRALVDASGDRRAAPSGRFRRRRQGPASFGRRLRHPRAAAAIRLGQGRARVAPPARHPGHRHCRADAGSDVAERRATRFDRFRRSRARPSAGRQDARSAAGHRPGGEQRRAAARTADGRGSDAQAAACFRDLGRRPAVGSEPPVGRNSGAVRRARNPPARR